MQTGTIISGVAHVSLIGWALFGGVFKPAPEPFEVTEVVAISEAEFESLLAGTEPPETVSDLIVPELPDVTPPEADTPASSQADQPPVLEQPEETKPPRPEARPELPEITPPTPAEVSDDVAVLAPPSDEPETDGPVSLTPSRPQEAPRVAPEAIAPPEPEDKVADVAQDVDTSDATGEEQLPDQEKTVEEAASTEIVTEAETAEPPGLGRSLRPRARPNRPTPPEPTEVADDTPPQPQDNVQSAVDDLLAGLSNDTANPTPPRPSGPPLTSGEKDALRVAVQKCWNTGSLSTEALKTTVVVGVSMNEDGTPDTGTIRMISSSGGTGGSVQQAFQAARRAIIRCGARGFALPSEKYEQWRDIEMTFNPEKMRIK